MGGAAGAGDRGALTGVARRAGPPRQGPGFRTLAAVTDELQLLADALTADYVHGRWRPEATEEHRARILSRGRAPTQAWTAWRPVAS